VTVSTMAKEKEPRTKFLPGQNSLRKPLTAQLSSEDPADRAWATRQIELALEQHGGNMTAAAEALGISWFTFYRNVKQAGLQAYAAELRENAGVPGRRGEAEATRAAFTTQLSSDSEATRALAKRRIQLALERHEGNMSAAADELGIARLTFFRNVRQAGLRDLAAKLHEKAAAKAKKKPKR